MIVRLVCLNFIGWSGDGKLAWEDMDIIKEQNVFAALSTCSYDSCFLFLILWFMSPLNTFLTHLD